MGVQGKNLACQKVYKLHRNLSDINPQVHVHFAWPENDTFDAWTEWEHDFVTTLCDNMKGS